MTNTASPSTQVEKLHGPPPSADALRELVALGQYAVVRQDGQVRVLPPEALPVWPTGATDAGATSNR